MNKVLLLILVVIGCQTWGQLPDSSQLALPHALEDDSVGSEPMFFLKNMPYLEECKEDTGAARNKCTRELISQKIGETYVVSEEARKEGIEGTTYIRFIVNRSGRVRGVKVMKSSGSEELDKSAVDAVEKLPRFYPGIQLDKPVSVYYTVPVKVSFKE